MRAPLRSSRQPRWETRSRRCPRPAINTLLHALPCGAVVLHRGEQVLLVGVGAPRRLGQAFQIRLDGFNTARQVVKPRAETVKQDRALQLGRLERARLDAAHEDFADTLAEQFDAELTPPAGQALRWRDLRQVGVDLQCGHADSFVSRVRACGWTGIVGPCSS